MQGIRSDNRFQEFIAELDSCDLDILLVSATWRDRREKAIVTAAGNKVFLSGGSCCKNGVGMCVSRRLVDQISGTTFFASSDRICCLHFTNGHHNFFSQFPSFSCYMPTSWEPDDAAEHVYNSLGMLLLSCDHAGAIPIIGGGFNAVIGNLLPGDDSHLLGTCGCGPRNDRGWMLVRWVLEDGLSIQSRLDRNIRHDDSWTCQRSMDGVPVQMDYTLSSLQLQLVKVKYDFAMPIGFDHRCVHCTVKIPFREKRVRKQSGFKCWRPILDDHGHRVAGRQTVEQHLRKDLSLQIRKIHRQDLRHWKSNHLNTFLCNPSRWKDFRDCLPRPSGRRSVIYPHVDDFASMLEALFVGPRQPLQGPMRLTERGWDLSELRFAIRRLKTGKCGDGLGLTAELIQNAPAEFLGMLLALYNNALLTGERPESWCKTLFSMLPKKNVAITTCRLQTNCEHSFIVQDVCISVAWTTRTPSASRTAGRTTWVSARTTIGRTPCYSQLNVG